MDLLKNLEVSRQWLYKDGFFVADAVRHYIQIFDGKREVLGEGSVAVDNPERGAIGAMGGHILPARETVRAMTGGVNFANDTLADQGTRGWDTRWIEYFFDH